MNYVSVTSNDLLSLGDEKNIAGNVNSRGYNWHHDWFRALNALDYYSYRYKYFYLENPPVNEGLDKSGDVYDSVQERIYSNVESIAARLQDERYNAKLKQTLREYLEDFKDRAIANEKWLYDSIMKDNIYNDYYGYDYDTLVNNTQPNNIVPIYNTIEFWTREAFPKEVNLGNLFTSDGTPIDPATAFAVVVGSKEFAEEFRIRTQKEMMKYFSQIVSGSSTYKQPTKQANNYLNMKDIFEALTNYLGQITEKKIRDALLAEIFNSFNEVGKDKKKIIRPWKTVNYEPKSDTDFTLKATFLSAAKEANRNLDDEDFKILLARFTNILGKINSTLVTNYTTLKQLEYIKKSTSFTLQLPNGFTLDDNSNIILLRQKNTDFQWEENGDLSTKTKNKIIKDVMTSISYTMSELEKRVRDNKEGLTLNALSLGKINFSNIIYVNNFFNAAQGFMEEIRPKLSQGIQRNQTLWKTFLARNSNAWFNGLFGELVGLVNFDHIFGKLGYRTKMTGATEATINGRKIGGSVNDIILSKKEVNEKTGKATITRFGANIKQYITKGSGTNFKLYGNSGKNGLFTSVMGKYLNAWQLNVVRFVLANSNYFQNIKETHGMTIEDIIFKTVLGSVPQFLRISDRTRASSDNWFFQINNVIYPTSYIYDCALDQLDKLISRSNDKSAFINISTVHEEGLEQGKSYKNLAFARRYWKDKNYRLSTSKKPDESLKNIKVSTNGIKINLVSL